MWRTLIIFASILLVVSGNRIDWKTMNNSDIEYYFTTNQTVNSTFAEKKCTENGTLAEFDAFHKLEKDRILAEVGSENVTFWINATGSAEDGNCTAVQVHNETFRNIVLPCTSLVGYICQRQANMSWSTWEASEECSPESVQCFKRSMITYGLDWNEYMIHCWPCVYSKAESNATTTAIVSTTSPETEPATTTPEPTTTVTSAPTTTATSAPTTTATSAPTTTVTSAPSTTVTSEPTTTIADTTATETTYSHYDDCPSSSWEFDYRSFLLAVPFLVILTVILAIGYCRLLTQFRDVKEELDYMTEGRRHLSELDSETRSDVRQDVAQRVAGNAMISEGESQSISPETPERSPHYENLQNVSDEAGSNNLTYVNTSFSPEIGDDRHYENLNDVKTGASVPTVLEDEDCYITPAHFAQNKPAHNDYQDIDETPTPSHYEATGGTQDHTYANMKARAKASVKIPRFVSIMKSKIALRPKTQSREEGITDRSRVEKTVPLNPAKVKKGISNADADVRNHHLKNVKVALKPATRATPPNAKVVNERKQSADIILDARKALNPVKKPSV